MKRILLPTLTLLFYHNGFTQETEIKEKIATVTTASDTLKNKKTEILDEVVISSKIGVTQVEPQKIRFSTKDLPSQNGGTAGDILKNMLSVSMGGSPNHNRDIRYRGLGNGYTTVLINGKQSGIIGNNRETVLDMLPSSQIDYIEIISTPTADQTANGINGIVNIVTKKGVKTNSNGQIQVFADNQNGYNGSVNLQHATDHFSISGSFDKLKRNANKFDDGTQTKFNTDGSLKETITIEKSEIKSFDNTTATAKIAYNTKNNWALAAEYIYGEQIEDKEKEELNLTYSNTGTFKSGKKRFSPEYKTSQFHNPSLNISKHGKNSSLDLTFNSNLTAETKNNLQQDYSTDAAGTVNYTKIPAQQLLLDDIKFKNYFPSIAYKATIGENGTIKTGLQTFLTNRTAERITTKLNNTTNAWEKIPTGTFTFDLDENTFAGYISANWDLNKFKLILGYRHEYTTIESVASSKENSTNESNYHLALPNFNLTYSLTDQSYLKSSIGRRVRRPAFADMNPFVEIKSVTEIKVGNPDLIPEKAWAYELGYFNEINKINFGVNVFHRAITDLIQKNITSDMDGITTESFTNLDKAISTGVEFLIGYQPAKWYNLNVNFSRFWSEIKDNTAFDGDALKDQTDWTFKAINDFKLTKGLNVQVIANFVGPKKTIQETEETIWFADLGIEKQLFNNGFFTIRVTDVFDTLKKQKTKNTIVQIEEMTENTPGRIFSAGFRYQF